MQITKIQIKKLFNNLDYEIPINLENRVTIIIGPNGSGKTVILKMLNSISNNDFSVFLEVPFKSFNIFFDNDTNISISRNVISKNEINMKNEKKSRSINITYFSEDKRSYTYNFSIPHRQNDATADMVVRGDKIGDYMFKGPNGSIFLKKTVPPDLLDCLMINKKSKKEEPFWYKNIRENIKTLLIGTDRLYSNKKIGTSNNNDIKSTVIMYSRELASHIQKKLSEFSSMSMILDKTFPVRLIEQQTNKYNLEEEQLFEQLKELENKRRRLKEAGLFYDKDDTNLNLLLKGNASEKSILSEVLGIYCEDTNEKLNIFNDLLAKIELFKNIIDRLFMYKKIEFNKDNGFMFYSLEGEHIPISSLSSGEQHELVLFYELIFKVKKNTFLLIDEPEISLHLFWQQQFLGDILSICKLSNINAIIATHSANIINNNWELTIDLEEQQDEKIY